MGTAIHTKIPDSSPSKLVFAQKDNAAGIDTRIRETIEGTHLSVLTMSLGLAKIKASGLYRDLGCHTMGQYITRLCNDTRMERSSFFYWVNLGKTFIKHEHDLEKIGFDDSDGPTKLRYLEKALKVHPRQDVFNNLKTMSLIEFIDFSRGKTRENIIEGSTWDADALGNSIFIDGKLAIKISNKLDRKVSNYFKRVLHLSCKVLSEEGIAPPVFLQNRNEIRRFREIKPYQGVNQCN